MKIDIINKSRYPLPEYKTSGSAGMDLRANIDETLRLGPGGRALIPTGLFMAIPEGFEGQIRSRSGLAYKEGVIVLNEPGTVDSDFRNEVKVLLYNTSRFNCFDVNPGDRIAQLVIKKVEQIEWTEVEELPKSDRKGGFGHTGMK